MAHEHWLRVFFLSGTRQGAAFFPESGALLFCLAGADGRGQVDSRRTNAPGITTVGATTVRAISSTSTRWVVRGGLQMVE